jgi:hypothetical protein
MISGQALDPLPIGAIFVLFVAVSLAVFEVGFRIGRWWQERTPDEKEGATGMLVGSLLAMLAFLLAVTMSMASSRFDTRRDLVLQEADAIGTTFLRAGYLPRCASGRRTPTSWQPTTSARSRSRARSGHRPRSSPAGRQSRTCWRSSSSR